MATAIRRAAETLSANFNRMIALPFWRLLKQSNRIVMRQPIVQQHVVNVLKFLLIVAIGFGIFQVMTGNAKVAEHLPDALPTKAVRTVTLAKTPFVARVRGYGNIEPAVEFSSRSELSAKVSYVHPELNAGGSIAAGTVVIRLDPQDFEISLSQTKSDLSSSRSDLNRLKQEQQNTKASLALAKQNLKLGKLELARVRSEISLTTQ